MSLSPWLHFSMPASRVGDERERALGLTTHLSLWPAATSFARWLEENSCTIGLNAPNAKILELGSGTGWLGCTLARNLPAAALVQLTDLPAALDELELYCNRRMEQHYMKNLVVCACDWENFTNLSAPAMYPCRKTGEEVETGASDHGWDIILGSDLVWSHTNIALLPFAIHAALRAGGQGCRAYYAHWQRTAWALPLLLEGLAKLGLQTECLNCPAISTEPSTPETLGSSSLQPEEVDGELDWTAAIFGDMEKEERPIFVVTKIWLGSEVWLGSEIKYEADKCL